MMPFQLQLTPDRAALPIRVRARVRVRVILGYWWGNLTVHNDKAEGLGNNASPDKYHPDLIVEHD